MFHDMPQAVADRMRYLEEVNAGDRPNDPWSARLYQVQPETGKFLALLAAGVPAGEYVEIGTSGGYSALWIALACHETGARLITYEVSDEKAALARETFRLAGVDDVVRLVAGDARDHIGEGEVAFCFLDAKKEIYLDCYELVVPRMVRGGLLVADNMTSHESVLKPMLRRALEDERVDAMLVPIGTGELVCRKR